MRTKKIRAIFKGKDGSMGYIAGKEYFFNIKTVRCGNIFISGDSSTVEYRSIAAFLDNWDNIVVIS